MDGVVRIGTELDTKSFEQQIKDIEYQLKEIDYELSHAKELKLDNKSIREYQLKAEKLNNQLLSLKQKQDALNKTNTFSNIGNSMEKIIKKVSKWALAVIGVRSVYLGIRSAMATLTQYDTKLQANVDYLKWALANTLKPIIEWIVNAMYTILGLIGKIIYAFSGYNIFKNSGIDDYKKAMASSSKSAKELKKTIAGFDEMNVVADNAQAGGGGGIGTPDMDFSKINDYESKISKVVGNLTDKWFKLGNDMREALANPQIFDKAFGMWSKFIQGVVRLFLGLWDAITGFVRFIGGIMDIIVGIFKGDLNLIKEGWSNVWRGIVQVFKGTIETITGLWQIGAGIIVGIFGEVWSGIKSIFSSMLDFFKKIISKIVSLFKSIGTKVGEAVGGAFTKVINAVLSSVEKILNKPINTINSLIKTINKVPGINLDKLSTISLPRLAKGTIASVPGRGIPTPNGVFAEAGREAYIPLSDTRLLEELGSTLGKYVKIDNVIDISMDSRKINRILQSSANRENFAMNR